MSGLSSTGFVPKTLNEIKAEISEALRTNVDPEINLAPEGMEGQILGMFSDANSEVYDTMEDVYNANTIFADGVNLDIIATGQGKKRDLGDYARIYDCQLTISQNVTIPTTAIFQNANGVQFSPIQEYNLLIADGATQDIDIEALVIGEIDSIPDNTVTEIVSSIAGLTSQTNDAGSTFSNGRDEETDEDLRIRIQSTSNAKEYTVNAIQEAVEAIDGVSSVTVVEDDDLHEVEIILMQDDTGSSTDTLIAQTIAFAKPAGTKTVSYASGVNKRTQTVQTGINSTVNIEYSRADSIRIVVNIVTTSTLTADQKTALKSYIATWSNDLLPGDDLIIYGTDGLFSLICNWTGGQLLGLVVTAKKYGGTFSTADIAIEPREVARIATTDITI